MKKILKPLIPAFIWNYLRDRQIKQGHKKVTLFWQKQIEMFEKGEFHYAPLPAKKDLSGKKIIWQYWGQGFDEKQLPTIVKICFASVDKYKGKYDVIRLSDENLSEYLDIPSFVFEKMRTQQSFTRTFFSDLLRILLLRTYGGVWLDATILLSSELPEAYSNMDFFVFQRDNTEANKKFWINSYAHYYGWDPDFKVKMLSSIIFGKSDSKIIDALYQLLIDFWKNSPQNIHYFTLQILYQTLIEKGYEAPPIVNDCLPHLLQAKLTANKHDLSYDEIFQKISIHKLTYKDASIASELQKALKDKTPLNL